VPPNPIRLEENTIDPNKIKGIQISGIFTSHEERHINKQRERERERERESELYDKIERYIWVQANFPLFSSLRFVWQKKF